MYKSLFGFVLSLLAFNINAEIISVDWKTTGDNLITKDTVSGLEWLDITYTANRSYNDISSLFGDGQEFDGWRYASSIEIGDFFDAFGGNSLYYDEWSTQNNRLFDAVAPYWGDTSCEISGCHPGEGSSNAIISLEDGPTRHHRAIIYDYSRHDNSSTMDYVLLQTALSYDDAEVEVYVGSALVRVSAVPIPAAVWLFGSGLIGLIGVARRKKA